jgi:hypothetical protein
MQKYLLAISIACTAFLGILSSASAATAGEASVSLGAEYTSGDYGTSTKTKMWYFPVTLKYETDRDMLALTVPYVSVEGTGNVVAAGEAHGLRRTTTSTVSRTESGLGDIVLAAAHNIAQTATNWRVDLGGKIKFGTADENKNLGTGEDDVAVQLDLEKSHDRNSIFGSAGYKVLGDPPGTDYRNVFYGSLGISHKLDGARAAGLELFAQQAALSGTDGQSELTLFLSNKLDNKTRLTGYLLKGFSDGSPDWGFGVALKLIQ